MSSKTKDIRIIAAAAVLPNVCCDSHRVAAKFEASVQRIATAYQVDVALVHEAVAAASLVGLEPFERVNAVAYGAMQRGESVEDAIRSALLTKVT
ncbi:MAG: hypothetical protein M0R28_17675 [Pigmentiphaga sp.]|nr:hypothetical protein [Pigmentiphaga sp.]